MITNNNHFEEWLGRSELIRGSISVEQAKAIAATLNKDTASIAKGKPLPPLWHWCFLHNPEPHANLGEDGHVRRGGFLPPIQFPHRMWAGSRVEFLQPIEIGQDAERNSIIRSIQQKQGKSGNLVFVTVQHSLSQAGVTRLIEEQDIVYRESSNLAKQAKPESDTKHRNSNVTNHGDFEKLLAFDTKLLFRYSAVTFNAHRIHYDREYAVQHENYPGLLVHGPLLATILADLLIEARAGTGLKSFSFRALAPVFDLTPIRLHGKKQNTDEYSLWVSNSENTICMQASAQVTL
jgi:3-methylfumaryl-CoA hydratase